MKKSFKVLMYVTVFFVAGSVANIFIPENIYSRLDLVRMPALLDRIIEPTNSYMAIELKQINKSWDKIGTGVNGEGEFVKRIIKAISDSDHLFLSQNIYNYQSDKPRVDRYLTGAFKSFESVSELKVNFIVRGNGSYLYYLSGQDQFGKIKPVLKIIDADGDFKFQPVGGESLESNTINLWQLANKSDVGDYLIPEGLVKLNILPANSYKVSFGDYYFLFDGMGFDEASADIQSAISKLILEGSNQGVLQPQYILKASPTVYYVYSKFVGDVYRKPNYKNGIALHYISKENGTFKLKNKDVNSIQNKLLLSNEMLVFVDDEGSREKVDVSYLTYFIKEVLVFFSACLVVLLLLFMRNAIASKAS